MKIFNWQQIYWFSYLFKILELVNEIYSIDDINDYYDLNLKYDRLRELGIIKADIKI